MTALEKTNLLKTTKPHNSQRNTYFLAFGSPGYGQGVILAMYLENTPIRAKG